jgi:hypothetical protein
LFICGNKDHMSWDLLPRLTAWMIIIDTVSHVDLIVDVNTVGFIVTSIDHLEATSRRSSETSLSWSSALKCAF